MVWRDTHNSAAVLVRFLLCLKKTTRVRVSWAPLASLPDDQEEPVGTHLVKVQHTPRSAQLPAHLKGHQRLAVAPVHLALPRGESADTDGDRETPGCFPNLERRVEDEHGVLEQVRSIVG